MVLLTSCSSTVDISKSDYPRLQAVVKADSDNILLIFPENEPIVMSQGSGKMLLKYLTDLRDWGLYHYDR